MKIPISEIFYSIQGEGRNTGLPSIFVRFWGCNLKCTWCDSKYSWDPQVEKAQMIELEEVIKIIKNFDCHHIIFTGGEPTLFQKQIKAIQGELGIIDYTFELETNGSKQIMEDIWFDQINISPKLPSSGNSEYELDILNSEDLFKAQYVDLKFVCNDLKTCKETDSFIQKISSENNFDVVSDIWIMPLGRDTKSQVNKYLIDYCMKSNYRYCTRQHLIWFGDGKGV